MGVSKRRETENFKSLRLLFSQTPHNFFPSNLFIALYINIFHSFDMFFPSTTLRELMLFGSIFALGFDKATPQEVVQVSINKADVLKPNQGGLPFPNSVDEVEGYLVELKENMSGSRRLRKSKTKKRSARQFTWSFRIAQPLMPTCFCLALFRATFSPRRTSNSFWIESRTTSRGFSLTLF